MTGGIDEGDRAGGAVLSLDRDLVGADVLGDAAVLGVDDVGVTDRVEQLGLTVVDVTHDGDDRRTGHHVLGVVEFFGFEVDVEGLEQLAVLVLGGDDLDVVAELCAQGLEGVLVEGLRGGRHLAQGKEDRHECCGIDVDLLGEVSKGCALADADLRAVAARDRHAADDGRVLLLVLLTLRALRLASALRAAASATECARRGAATAAATAARTAEAAAVVLGGAAAGTCTCTAGTCAAATASTAAGALTAAVTGGSVTCEVRLAGHHARVRTVAAGTRGAGTRTAVTGGTLTRGAGARATVAGAARTRSAGTRAARAAGARHALRGGVGVVARARATGARATGASRTRGVSATRRGLGGTAFRALAGGGLGGGVGLLRTRLGRAGLGRVALGGSGLGGGVGSRCGRSLRLGGGGLLRSGLSRAGLGGLGGGLCVRLLGLGGRRELLAHLPHDGRFERG